MIYIHLDKLLFHAFHGIHDEEKVLGNQFEVNCKIGFHEKESIITHIDDTLDYSSLYNLIQNEMNIPTLLLETVAMRIGHSACIAFPDIKNIEVTIKKLSLPMAGFQGAAGVTWYKEF
ncbi:MAG: dihydroneopterin aldolase [Bacteroidetes bacterium]|nr:dihydroneopterin aldolase [Bacteroidota bacterium]